MVSVAAVADPPRLYFNCPPDSVTALLRRLAKGPPDTSVLSMVNTPPPNTVMPPVLALPAAP